MNDERMLGWLPPPPHGETASVWCDGSKKRPHDLVHVARFRCELFGYTDDGLPLAAVDRAVLQHLPDPAPLVGNVPHRVERSWALEWHLLSAAQQETYTPGLREWSQYQFRCPECPMAIEVKDMALVATLLDGQVTTARVAIGSVTLARIDFAQKAAAARRKRT